MGNSFILIVVGLLLFYLVVSDKWNCFEGFLACVIGKTEKTYGAPLMPSNNPITPNLPTINNTIGAPIDLSIFNYAI